MLVALAKHYNSAPRPLIFFYLFAISTLFSVVFYNVIFLTLPSVHHDLEYAQLSATGAAWAWYQGEGVDARTRQQRQATVVGALVLLGALAPTTLIAFGTSPKSKMPHV